MPCYTVRLMSVVFKAKHKSILKEAAKELGWIYSEAGRYVNIGTIQIDMEKQEATINQYQQDSLNQLKRKYSDVALKTIAKKQGWKLFNKKTEVANTQKYVLQKF